MDEQDPIEIPSIDQNIDASPVAVHPDEQEPNEVLPVIPPVDLIKNTILENLHVDEKDSGRIPPVEPGKDKNRVNPHMDEPLREILMGIIILFLIVDTIAIFSMASGSYLQNPSPTIVTPPVETTAPVPSVTSTPQVVSTTPPPVVKTAIPTPVSTPVPARAGYVNIFSMKDKELQTALEPIFFNLANPPLIIDFSVIPQNITDIKYFEYKEMSTVHHDSVNITRPYEDAGFIINVTNIDTGKFIEDGYGKEYGLQSPKNLKIMERGNYTIRVKGQYINFSLSIEVPKERNIP